MFNQYVNRIGIAALGWKLYMMYVVVLVLKCVTVWGLYVETKDPTLEKIAVLSDGEDACVVVAGVRIAVGMKGDERREKEVEEDGRI
jgi:uncharacterized membrane protein YccF (DUF307 family)